jgi:myo-inositol-1(or 4)-monophosphatase
LRDPDLALLIAAARAAGPIALRYFKQNPKVWEKPGEGPVTEADFAVNDALQTHLRGARPGYGWLSEEGPDDPFRAQCEHVFMIDPIDGTRAFIAGDSSFSHSLAVVRNGEVTAAVVYLPAKSLLFAASLTDPATCNGRKLKASAFPGVEGASLLTTKPNLAPEQWLGPVPEVNRGFKASVAYRLCLVAEGAFDGLLSLRDPKHWDIAAGALIAARAGAVVTDRHGQALTYTNSTSSNAGLVAGSPGLHAGLLARLKT